MAETPMDIIMKHLSTEWGRVENDRKLGQFDGPEFNVLATATAINEELRQNFRIITPPAPWATDEEALASTPGTLTIPKEMLDGRTLHVGHESQAMPITLASPPGTTDITVHATGNPMLFYIGTDLAAYRLDDVTVPNSMGFPRGREAQLALALVDVSASRLRKVTR